LRHLAGATSNSQGILSLNAIGIFQLIWQAER